MKTIRPLLLLTVSLALAGAAVAAKPLAGPKGGRIVTTAAPHIEFLVASDRSVVVSFYDADLRPLAAAGQVVNATAELPSGRVKLDFTPKDGALVSTTPLPGGGDFRVVLQVRDTAEAKPRNFRIDLNLARCDGCNRAEYACLCEDH